MLEALPAHRMKNPSEPKPKAQAGWKPLGISKFAVQSAAVESEIRVPAPASRGGVEAARYSRRGLSEPAKKQIRWHHGLRHSS